MQTQRAHFLRQNIAIQDPSPPFETRRFTMFSRRSLSKKVRFQDQRRTDLIASNLAVSRPKATKELNHRVSPSKVVKEDRQAGRSSAPSRHNFEDIQSRILALEIAVSEALAVGKSSSKAQGDPSRAVGLQAQRIARFKDSRPHTSKSAAAIEDVAKRLASENAQLVRQLKEVERASRLSNQKFSRRLSNIEVTLQQLLVAVSSAVAKDSEFPNPRGGDEDRMLREAVLLSQITELQRRLEDAKILDIALMASTQHANGHQSPPPYDYL